MGIMVVLASTAVMVVVRGGSGFIIGGVTPHHSPSWVGAHASPPWAVDGDSPGRFAHRWLGTVEGVGLDASRDFENLESILPADGRVPTVGDRRYEGL